MKIGIPRALLFYHFYPLWKTFFENLGFQVILSPETNKKILERGIDLAVDDACLPVKLYHGHVAELIGNVDILFVPRIISIHPKEYICPKFLGLPDIIKCNVPNLPFVIDTEINLHKRKTDIFNHFLQVGKLLNKSKFHIVKAYFKAVNEFNKYNNLIKNKQIIPIDVLNSIEKKSILPEKQDNYNYKVLLLGHPYNIYDKHISMNLISKIKKMNVKVITYEMLSKKDLNYTTKLFSKPLFWTLGKRILGCANHFLRSEEINGIVHVASFGCGPDSLVGELLERKMIREYRIPFLYLNLDEQTGEAGINTRLEAFLDIVEGRKYIETYIPTYG
ncbi:MAG: acyl-CoA dehydratase activase-related protein [Tepidanaerobacteraceae bacterium]